MRLRLSLTATKAMTRKAMTRLIARLGWGHG
jgi:hypothetical protein